MKYLLSKMAQLNEAKEASYSPSYRVGKTGDFKDKPNMKRGTPVAGKVGKYGKTSDELGDPDQDPDDDTTASAEKRGRGRPKKAGGAADTKDRYSGAKDLQNVMIGKMPKSLPGKKGTVHKSPQDKEANESTKKKSLKDWVERVESVLAENTATTTSTATAPSSAQKVMVKPGQPAGQKPPATMTTQTGQTIAVGSADQVKKLGDLVNTGQVQLTKPGTTEPLDEEGDEKWIKGAIKHPGAFTKKAKSHGMKPSSFAKKVLANKEDYPASTEKQANLAKTLGKFRKKTDEADIPPNDSLMSPISETNKKSVKEAAKPDYIDLDKDGDKKESMRKAAADKKKKAVKEGRDHHLKAAYHEGKAHGLSKQPYNCRHDDMEEARQYHEGYKCGLDECYGQQPILGYVGEESQHDVVDTMASYGAHGLEEDDMMEVSRGEYMKQQARKPGDTFKAFGQTFRDSDVLDEFAFESWDKQLTAILEGKEVNEGMTVSISKGHQGSPDSVSVSAQDGEADQLLGLIKSAGLGLFGGDESKGFAPGEETPRTAPGGIEVVDDHDGMMALMKKLTGGDTSGSDGDYEEEHGHDHEQCNECGYMESDCQCDKEMVDEVESEDQMTYNVAEDNPPDSGAAETTADENAEAVEDQAIATDDEFQNVNEWANQIGEGPGKGTDAGFEQDIAFMTKVISGGLNKQKSTGQTTIPVIAHQGQRTGVNENYVADWKKLAGIK